MLGNSVKFTHKGNITFGVECVEWTDENRKIARNKASDRGVLIDERALTVKTIETTKEIRQKWDEIHRFPIVALTANAIAGVEKIFVEAGMDAFMAKPIIPAKLEEILLEFISKDKWSES